MGSFGVGINVGVFVVGEGANDDIVIGLGSFVASTLQAERAKPAEVTPASFRKSLRVILCFLILEFTFFSLRIIDI